MWFKKRNANIVIVGTTIIRFDRETGLADVTDKKIIDELMKNGFESISETRPAKPLTTDNSHIKREAYNATTKK